MICRVALPFAFDFSVAIDKNEGAVKQHFSGAAVLALNREKNSTGPFACAFTQRHAILGGAQSVHSPAEGMLSRLPAIGVLFARARRRRVPDDVAGRVAMQRNGGTCQMANRTKSALNSTYIPPSAPLATHFPASLREGHSRLATAFLIPVPGLEIAVSY